MLLKLMAMYASREDGATAIEYGLIAAGIAVAISAAVFLVGEDITGLFGEVSGKLNEAGGGA